MSAPPPLPAPQRAFPEGSDLNISWSAGLIATSYVVSAAGAWVALELIRLRTSNRGWFNWVLLLLASFVTGGLAIFSMHFVGMAAFQLYHAHASVKVFFATGLTIGSLIEPIFCVCVGVYITGAQDNPSNLRLLLGGVFAALGICLMHFTAMTAMRVAIDWIPALVFLSCLIALFATTTALSVFFRLRAVWQNSLWKQLGCAMILAGAVCCMHYTGMAAANYAIDPNFPPQSDAVTHGTLPVNDVLRIGLGFSGFCGVLTLGLLLMRLRNYYYGIGVRKGQLTLAVLLVDSRGHIMVDSEGHLPTRAVLGNFDFDPARPMAHPALLWLLKTSGAWDKINHLAYAFRKHGGRVYRLLQDVLVDRPDGELANRRMPFYRLALVHEVVTLSTFMGIPFDRMGLMYDTVLEARDGWVGLLVDHLDSCRAGELAARGFRWTSQKHVITILSRHLRVSAGAIRPIILDVPDYVSTRTRPLKSGLHAGVLLVHPKIGNFQIMVPSRDRSTIPEVELSPIAFGALKDNARRLNAYLAPILTGGGGESMVMADYVAASEILSALTRMGIGMDPASALPLESLTPPESVLVLHRKTKPMDAPGDSPKLNPPKNGREEYPWVSRVPFGSWSPSPNSGDVDILLFIRLHSAVGGKFTPPAGFTLVDLTVFEAMHYARCFPARLRRILGLEMNADLDEMIVPTPLGLLDSGDSKRTSAQKVPISNLWRDSVGSKMSATDGTTSRTLSEDKHGHVVLNVDDILREGPPEDVVSRPAMPHSGSKGTLVNPPESTRLSLPRRMSLHKLKKALGFTDRSAKDATNDHFVPDLSIDATPLAEFRPHSEPSGALSDDDEPIPDALGPEASPAANAWQAVRWVKLYINADWRHLLNAGTKSNGIGGFLFGGPNWSKMSINGEDGGRVSRSNSAT